MWYLQLDNENSGAWNMAYDQYFTENPPDAPLLRFYSWKPSAVSLGYNQKRFSYNEEVVNSLGYDIIRRPTGGRAVFHDNEVTYSVIIPNDSPYIESTIHGLYRRISAAILHGLREAGADAGMERNRLEPYDVKSNTGVQCFDSTARFEIKTGSEKLVGSAQRRLSKAVLQHGSILMEDRQEMLKLICSAEEINEDAIRNVQSKYRALIAPDISKSAIIDSVIEGFKKEYGIKFSNLNIKETHLEKIRLNSKDFIVYSGNKK